MGSPASAAPSLAESAPRALASQYSHDRAVPGIAPPGADRTAVYLDALDHVLPQSAHPDATCTPDSGRDNPHRSGTGVAVSGHGWWSKGTCKDDYAKVYNCLYEWYTDNTWRRKACSPVKKLKPGGGSTHRTAARHDCTNTELTSWRNHVDVDVMGENDTGEQPMRQAEVRCQVD
jgi:hypothetical protein